MSHHDSIFTSWIQAKFDKNNFLCLKTPFLAQSYTLSAWYQDKKPPDKNPPDINPQTKIPWTKTPLAKTPQTKTPQRKLMNTKYILHK